MSSRGFFIGKVIDDLEAIKSQVAMRCELGQNDLNSVLENFFRDILNLTRNATLANLNVKRSNEPGLDLGDKTSSRKLAFQVTSRADAAKINDTLKKITDEQLALYDEINVLIIGERKKNYKLDPILAAKCKFSEKNVIGIADLCREIMDTDIGTIQAVQAKLQDERTQIRIELQPMINDKFETTVLDLLESRPSVARSDGSILQKHEVADGLFSSASEAAKALDYFIDELERLPRLSREFFGWMIDNSERRMMIGAKGNQINADYAEQKATNMDNLQTAIRLLTAWGFIDFDQDENFRSGHFSIYFPGAQRTNLSEVFIDFLSVEKLSASTLFSTMNFSAFGPTPVPTTAKVPIPTKSAMRQLKRPPKLK